MATYLLPEPILTQLSALLSARMGWYFPPDRWHDLERGICAVARDLGFSDVQACVEWLDTSPLTQQHVEIFADRFTVGETYFFREQRALEILTHHILPPLIQARQHAERRLRIWSAACCTGEEPYSIAMTLNSLPATLFEWNVSILGTDINPRFLQRAEFGIYGEWSFRNTPAWMKERYFEKTEESRYRILPQIKQMVTFLPVNLADALFPPPLNSPATIDVIFCRNVFIYFSPERAQTVINNFHHLLTPGGWLIVSPSEISYLADSPFEAVQFPGAILHRKRNDSAAPGQLNKLEAASVLPQLPSIPSGRPAHVRMPANEEHRVTSASVQKAKHPYNAAVIVPPVATVTPLPASAHPEANYARAAALYEQGRYVEAGELLLDLLINTRNPIGPSDGEAMILLIRSYANQGALADALMWCRKAVVDNPVNHRLYYLLAILLLEQGDDEGATLSLKRTLFLKNDFVLAHFTLGNLARRQKKEPEAQKHFRNALSLLNQYRREDLVPDSEGMTAGRLSDLLCTMLPYKL